MRNVGHEGALVPSELCRTNYMREAKRCVMYLKGISWVSSQVITRTGLEFQRSNEVELCIKPVR